MIAVGLILAATAAPPGSPTYPPACEPYKVVLTEMDGLDDAVLIGGARLKPRPSIDTARLLAAREALAVAMKAANPDFALIERLMREELRLREVLHSRISSAKIGCDVAVLRSKQGEEQRRMLDLLRPQTQAEVEERRKTIRVAPPAPPPVLRAPEAPRG